MADGTVTFTFKTGRQVSTTGTYVREDNYLDANKRGRDYPSPLDFGKLQTVRSITFSPNPSGKAKTWASWTYFNNPNWEVDRFTDLQV
jgi:hypothetical protein